MTTEQEYDADQLSLLDADLRPESHARATDPGTSHDAAAKLSDKKTMMTALLREFEACGLYGLTAEEACAGAGFTAQDGAWKRVSDLKRAGLVDDSGYTRTGSSGRQQSVLRITAAGYLAVRS